MLTDNTWMLKTTGHCLTYSSVCNQSFRLKNDLSNIIEIKDIQQ